MVCPYCSTDMTPIELNGKVFCSNCGLTVENNSVPPVANTINPTPEKVNTVETNAPEEVDFPVIPEVVAATTETPHTPMSPSPEEILNSVPDAAAIDYFGQFSDPSEDTAIPGGVKLNVMTEEPQVPAEVMNPITSEAMNDLGISETPPAMPEEPVLESKISDLTIPSEEDFAAPTPEPEAVSGAGSFVELPNPGNTQETLEASSILLDILGDEKKSEAEMPPIPALDPLSEPEIPENTMTKEENDIYTIPSEVKVGFRNKKIQKAPRHSEPSEESRITDPGSFVPTQDDEKKPEPEIPDPIIQEEINKLEEEIAEAPEPVVDLDPTEAAKYDPDAINLHDDEPDNPKAKIIKDYFSTAIEKDKQKTKTKVKKAKKKHALKAFVITIMVTIILALLGVASYFAYDYLKPEKAVQVAKESADFSTEPPEYVPDGYELTTSDYNSESKTFETVYEFATDSAKTITYKQTLVENPTNYISNYLREKNATYSEKTVGNSQITEYNGSNIIWSDGEFVYSTETKNYTFTNDLLYKMAGMSVE